MLLLSFVERQFLYHSSYLDNAEKEVCLHIDQVKVCGEFVDGLGHGWRGYREIWRGWVLVIKQMLVSAPDLPTYSALFLSSNVSQQATHLITHHYPRGMWHMLKFSSTNVGCWMRGAGLGSLSLNMC